MPKKCIICKHELNPVIVSNRSYHMFPKNKVLRQKWITNLRLSNNINFKNAHVCSEHFDKNSFYPFDELRIRKRLCPEAVPKVRPLNALTQTNVNIPIIEIDSSDDDDSLEDISLELNMLNEIDICTDNDQESLKNYDDEVSDDSNFEVVNEEDLFNDFKPNYVLNECPNNTERKQPVIDLNVKKKVRYSDGMKTGYITREDFVSDDAWDRFFKFINYKNSKLAAAHNKNSRKEKKLKICLELVADLLRKEENRDA